VTEVRYRYRFLPERKFEFVSDTVTQLIGYTPEEHYQDPDLGLKIVHPADLGLLRDFLAKGGSSTEPLFIRWIARDGRVVLTQHVTLPERDEEGRVVAIDGIARALGTL
jgi:PAS domain-containing protein